MDKRGKKKHKAKVRRKQYSRRKRKRRDIHITIAPYEKPSKDPSQASIHIRYPCAQKQESLDKKPEAKSDLVTIAVFQFRTADNLPRRYSVTQNTGVELLEVLESNE
jgi:hypothetical protein